MSRRRRVRLAREGSRFIALSAIMVITAVVFSLLRQEGRALWLPAITAVWFLFVILFFRDPEAFTPQGKNLVIAPASGKVTIAGTAADSPFESPVIHVSIFMSVFDVHINHSPVNGEVKSIKHHTGNFMSVLNPKALQLNENLSTEIQTEFGKVGLKQIAGLIARRIVFNPKVGDSLRTGQRVGMIKFGSRVDVFLPNSVQLKVKIGDRVTAGETVLGEFRVV